MTPARFLIILAVVVLVLFGVSLAVRSKTGDARENTPSHSWVSGFNKHLEERQKVDPEKDFSSSCRTGRQLLIPKVQAQCTVTVTVTTSSRGVRNAKMTLKGVDKFKLEYTPSSADAEAVSLKIDEVKPNQTIKLVFQKGGGQLTLTRLGVLADAIVTLE